MATQRGGRYVPLRLPSSIVQGDLFGGGVCIDSHIHLDVIDRDAVLRFVAATPGYSAMVPGIEPAETEVALRSLGEVPGLHFAAALHPWRVAENPDWQQPFAALEDLINRSGICAVGETGLDMLKAGEGARRRRVEAAFQWHLELASASGLPLVVHCVRAHGRCIEMLRAFEGRVHGVIHAFSGSVEVAAEYRRLGFLVGIGAAVTRRRSRRVRAAAAAIPDSQLLLETDAPFMRVGESLGDGRPEDIRAVAAEVSELRGVSSDELRSIVRDNFIGLFGM